MGRFYHPLARQRGNILFLILLAVILFAALSYAVTSSMRGGGADISNEKAQTQAAEILNYFAQLDAAVQRMMLTGGVKDYELNFYYQSDNKYITGYNDNTNCTQSRCRIFDPAGGGVIGKDLTPLTRTGLSDAERIYYISIPGVGTSAPDIVFQMNGLFSKTCLEINKRIGLNDVVPNSGITSQNGWMYQNALPVGPIPDNGEAATNIPPAIGSSGTFCTCLSADLPTCEAVSTYRPSVWHVLVAR